MPAEVAVAAEDGTSRLARPWIGHLLVFALLLCMVFGWFFFQTGQAQRVFLDDAREHARLLADAVALHARGAVLAEEVTESILIRFLGSSARFVDYLDGVEPFRPDELGAFAAEAGLSAIRIVRGDGIAQGPASWQPIQPPNCDQLGRPIRIPELDTLMLGIARADGSGCVLVGMDSRQLQTLRAEIGLPRALQAVAGLPGVAGVKLLGEPSANVRIRPESGAPAVVMLPLDDGRPVARASAEVAGATLILDMDAGPLLRIRERLWLEFLAFALVLALTGGFGAWLLYRYQARHDCQVQDYERRLSRQREEAGLGRASAAIAHEIRNPLNAMAMGLQRLQMEAGELSPEHRRLVALVLEATSRANRTVTGLLDYARAYRPLTQAVALDVLVADRLSLYRGRIAEQGLELVCALRPKTRISADPQLLGQVFDNLLVNALDAAPAGSLLEIKIEQTSQGGALYIANDGLTLAGDQVTQILDPWFTTKTEGTGLGLAISQRIVAAHGGRLTLEIPRSGRLSVRIDLPKLVDTP